jgi:glucose-1-phosphate cytidylyltransferase
MKMYSHSGVNDFIICCGYKGYLIKEYFANYFLHTSDITFDMHTNQMEVHQKRAESWKVTLVDTGDSTMTGGRLLRVADYIKNEEVFCLTYGDGLGDNDIASAIAFHKSHGKAATLTATYPPGRFGALDIQSSQVKSFKEKPRGDGALINGGFFVLEPEVAKYIHSDDEPFELGALPRLVQEGQLMAYEHAGFWQPMDTLREKNELTRLSQDENPPWLEVEFK